MFYLRLLLKPRNENQSPIIPIEYNYKTCLNDRIFDPDLPAADHFLIPKLNTPMKGKHFATIEEIREKSKQQRYLRLWKCIVDWKKLWFNCITNEGDKIVNAK